MQPVMIKKTCFTGAALTVTLPSDCLSSVTLRSESPTVTKVFATVPGTVPFR